jgi:large subunit ribosomal protein L25
MADLFELPVEIRQNFGKGAARRLRRLDQKVPAVIYGAGKPALSVMLTQHHLGQALKNEAVYSHILTLKLDTTEEKVVLKDLQRHPSKPLILHADFLRVSATEKLDMHVPLHFLHEDVAPGVKLQKGIISHMLNEVEIRCLPADLPEYIAVDLSQLNLGETIHLSELKLPKGVELVALSHADDRPVVSIHKLVVIEESEEPVAAPAAEVPVVGKETSPEESVAKEKEGGKK